MQAEQEERAGIWDDWEEILPVYDGSAMPTRDVPKARRQAPMTSSHGSDLASRMERLFSAAAEEVRQFLQQRDEDETCVEKADLLVEMSGL